MGQRASSAARRETETMAKLRATLGVLEQRVAYLCVRGDSAEDDAARHAIVGDAGAEAAASRRCASYREQQRKVAEAHWKLYNQLVGLQLPTMRAGLDEQARTLETAC